MTNEEIERVARVLAVMSREYGHEQFAPHIALELRSLVSQTYEEAAQIADKWANDPHGSQEWDWAAEKMAEEIRALKDSLVQEPVAST